MGHRRAGRTLTALALLAAAAVGVGGARAQPPRGGPDCKVAQQARLPLRESRGRFSAEVELDGQPLAMLIDTGAQRAAVSPETAERLRLPTDAAQTFRAIGVGGRTVGEHPRVARSIRFGPAVWPRYRLQTVNVGRPGQGGEADAPVGVIGGDMLSAYDVELDFPARAATLHAVSGCSGDFVPWAGPHDVLTPLKGPADLFIVAVTLNGHQIRALLDTGSNTSSLSLGGARAAGVDDAALKRDQPDSYVGTRGVAVAAHRHRFDSLTIGTARFSNARISVQEADFGPFDMLLGMDYLGSRRLWLSYRTHQLFIQAGQAEPLH